MPLHLQSRTVNNGQALTPVGCKSGRTVIQKSNMAAVFPIDQSVSRPHGYVDGPGAVTHPASPRSGALKSFGLKNSAVPATWFRSPVNKGGGPKKPAHVSGENGAGFYFPFCYFPRFTESILPVHHLSYRIYGLIQIGGITTCGARFVARVGDGRFGQETYAD